SVLGPGRVRLDPAAILPAWATTVRLVMHLILCLAPARAGGQTTNFLLNPEEDAFVREAAPTNNYGRAGAVSVGGVGATNGFGVLGGRVESLVRFRLSDALPSLDAAMGGHEWFIAAAGLQLYEMGAPNNPLFNRGIGALEVRWLASGDNWQEG